ncbi:UDP-N-acetylglucosamine 1-carboxyvinyltransferase [Candidatus Saccharibacteria bacterium CPR2]|nr:UDP-N-acetylglucosamine 1-carboxyvinyltransferase [Candidatus Saccharibacteria bacterium CPR2]
MTLEKQKIGNFIRRIRNERGLTQQQLASKLNTSQSAINRIEKGRQNLSMEMLARLSDVLDASIITFSGGSTNYKIEGGHSLSGEIETKVSKNASVGLLCASLLNQGTTVLRKIPKIEEVFRIIEVLESIGVNVKWLKNNDLELKPPKKLRLDKMNLEAGRRTRSVIMLMGPLVHLFNNFKIPYAGGCRLGKRSVAPHLYALEEFGVNVKTTGGYYHTSVRKKQPERLVLYESGDTVTENVLMTAAKMTGTTEIRMASANYMVQEMCLFLRKLGVKIEGLGTTTLKITGAPVINKRVVYSPSEDPIESMLFLSIAAITNSRLTIKRCPFEFLELELLKLKHMGYNFKIIKKYKADNGYTDLVDIKTEPSVLVALTEKIEARPFPGLNIDNLPFFVPISAIAKGRTLIHDWVYEDRAIYYTELNKLGASISLVDPHRVYIDGPSKFRPAEIVAPPALRPAVIILIAMLGANGVSVLRNVYSISRGYENLPQRLNSIGAKIEVMRDI